MAMIATNHHQSGQSFSPFDLNLVMFMVTSKILKPHSLQIQPNYHPSFANSTKTVHQPKLIFTGAMNFDESGGVELALLGVFSSEGSGGRHSLSSRSFANV
ncbi:hypothetical protein C1H46_019892 [Malus baccata]|uniref:Uncharacterized protein n=1 Tax=Malus baccata TaxID=106549 RepID=A0A540M6T9_MALBA|nr:hypothetical protein C1H46_019892 [Malus baccata]